MQGGDRLRTAYPQTSFIHSFDSLGFSKQQERASTKGGMPSRNVPSSSLWCKLHPVCCGSAAASSLPCHPLLIKDCHEATGHNVPFKGETTTLVDVQGACTSETLR